MFHLTGWKVGYVLACEELTKNFRKVHQYISFSVNTPAQYALAKYLEVFNPEKNQSICRKKEISFGSI